jgi:hypothetical protein
MEMSLGSEGAGRVGVMELVGYFRLGEVEFVYGSSRFP